MDKLKKDFVEFTKKHLSCENNKTGELINGCKEKYCCENYKLLRRIIELLIEEDVDNNKNE